MLSVSVLAKRRRGLRRQLLPETRCPSWGTLVGPVDVSVKKKEGNVRFVAGGSADTAVHIRVQMTLTDREHSYLL